MSEAAHIAPPETSATTSRRALAVAIAASFVFGLGLRLWNIRWGLPFNYHPGEQTVYDVAMAMVRGGHAHPQWFGWPSALLYVQLAATHGLHWLADLPIETLGGPAASPGMIAEGQWGYLLAGRVLVAVLGAVTAGLTAAAAGRLRSGWTVPLVAGFLAAMLPLHVRHSHFLTPEVPAGVGLTLALLAALGILKGGRDLRRALWAGAAVGLAAGFAYGGALAAIPVGLAILFGDGRRWKKLPGLLLAATAAAAVFLLCTPDALVSRSAVLAGARHPARFHLPGDPVGLDTGVGEMFARLVDPGTAGPAVLVLALLCIPLLATSRVRRQLGRPSVVLLGILAALLASGPAGWLDFETVLVLSTPAIALLAGVTLAGLWCLLPSRFIRAGVGLLVAAALVPVATAGGQDAFDLRLKRTETAAYEWFLTSVPADARVIREWSGPQLPTERYRVLALRQLGRLELSELSDLEPDYVVVGDTNIRLAPTGSRDRPEAGRMGGAYGELLSTTPAALFCPEPDRLAGPEIRVFALSRRARALHSEAYVSGVCR